MICWSQYLQFFLYFVSGKCCIYAYSSVGKMTDQNMLIHIATVQYLFLKNVFDVAKSCVFDLLAQVYFQNINVTS